MKGNSEQLHETPVKKWLRMSPFQDDLAIIESESSENNQGELFNQLVGYTPSFHGDPDSSSPSECYDSSFQSSCSASRPDLDEHCENSYTVNQMKPDLQSTTEKAELRAVDLNRKGCNCRNSKCEKNYCDCFKMGLACAEGLCSCEDCHNTEEREVHREVKRMKEVEAGPARRCTCRKSRCLKKYCECHSSGRKCSSLCECIECSNQDENERTSWDRMRKMRKAGNASEEEKRVVV